MRCETPPRPSRGATDDAPAEWAKPANDAGKATPDDLLASLDYYPSVRTSYFALTMLAALLVMALGAVLLGAALGYAAVRFRVEGDPLVEKIDAILPQTQCGQCGFPGCKPYAGAIAKGEAEINQCPPGGDEGIRKLADLLGREFKSLSAEHGIEKPKSVAVIDEPLCIGCTLCIQACPVDAIVGAAKQMHTVIARQCTGCELCLPPCPVDCISMQAVVENVETWKWKYPVVKINTARREAA